MLFDLQTDPQEFDDLGNTAGHAATQDRLYAMLRDWSLRLSQRVTMSEAAIDKKVGEPQREAFWSVYTAKVISAEFTSHYTGPARQSISRMRQIANAMAGNEPAGSIATKRRLARLVHPPMMVIWSAEASRKER